MVFHPDIKRIKAKRKVITFFTLFIASLYLAGISGVARLHRLSHTHEVVSHTGEQEKDPCHRALYHQDLDHGCHHETHLTVSDSCDVCDLILHAEYIYSVVSSNTSSTFLSADFFCAIEDIHTSDIISLPARAPPFAV